MCPIGAHGGSHPDCARPDGAHLPGVRWKNPRACRGFFPPPQAAVWMRAGARHPARKETAVLFLPSRPQAE
ncbi:hypothetical protein D7X33_02750 [Butyricicoccus sp. 1XD8-22]|nr:hypothetical protein D7X33_02750 [Butyricicoccus sp. 1XD8-22]